VAEFKDVEWIDCAMCDIKVLLQARIIKVCAPKTMIIGCGFFKLSNIKQATIETRCICIITLRAGETAAQCIVIAPVCLCVFVRLLPRQLEIACIDSHQTGFDRLQLVKFWPSRAPGKGVCGGAKIFGSALQPARSVCVASGRVFIQF